MSLLLKIVVFIVFLVFLSGFYIGSFLFSRRIQRLLSEGRLFLLGQVMLLASVFSLFSFVWLLSGFFSWRLTLFFVLAAEVGGVVTGVLWRFMGSTDLPWAASSTWTGAEIAIRHPWLPQILGIVSALVLLAYPIACGFEFFSHEVPSPDVTVAIFRFTLIALFLPGLLITLPTIVSMLSSRNLDEGTRLRVLLAQGGGLFSNALVIALVLWSFGIVSKGYNFDLGGIPLTASPMLGLVVFVYFAATFLLPFYMGTAQAKKWRLSLLHKQKSWLEKMVEALDFPAPAQFDSKLRQLSLDLSNEANQIRETDKMVSLGKEFDEIDSREEVPAMAIPLWEAYHRSRDLEPRFTYMDFLSKLQGEIEQARGELEKVDGDDSKLKRAADFRARYHSENEKIRQNEKTEEKTRPLAIPGLATLAGCIASPLLGELSQWIWKIFLARLG